MADLFARFARRCAWLVGSAPAFGLACLLILVWAATGPLLHFSDTWQLVINTLTTLITFLVVFLIQNTQNTDSASLHLKLDELLRANQDARNTFIDIEHMSPHDRDHLQDELNRIRVTSTHRDEDRAPVRE